MRGSTTVAITKEAGAILDSVAKASGLSKIFLASEIIKTFFDSEKNPNLQEALLSFEADRSAGAKLFVDRVIAHRSKEEQ